MPHNEDVLRNTLLAPTSVITPNHVKRLDQLASESINGDEGGSWNPTSPIVIGGDGVYFDNAGQISGGVRTGPLAAQGALELSEGHWPSFTSERTREVVFSLNDGMFNNRENIFSNLGTAPDPNGIRFDASTSVLCPLPSHRFPRGATIRTITMCYRVGVQPIFVPASPPTFLLFAKTGAKNEGYPVTKINTWKPGTAYASNSIIVATSFVPDVTSKAFYAALGGTSGVVEPAGFTTANPGDNVFDNGVAWTCFSLTDVSSLDSNRVVTEYSVQATPALYYNANQPQTAVVSSVNVFPTVADGEYFLYLRDVTGTKNTHHSLVVEFLLPTLRPGF